MPIDPTKPDPPKPKPKDLKELKDARKAAKLSHRTGAQPAFDLLLADLLAAPDQGFVVQDRYVADLAREYGLDVSVTSGSGFYVQVPDDAPPAPPT